MDMDRLCSDLVAFHRDLMILKTVEKPERFIVALPEEMEEMKPLAQFLTLSQILYAFCFAGGAESYVPANRRTELEMSVVRICNPAMDSSAEAVLTRLEALEAAVRRGIPAAPSSLPEPAESGEKAANIYRRRKRAPSPLEQAAAEEKHRRPFWQICLMRILWRVAGGSWQTAENQPAVVCSAENSDAYEKGDLMLIDAKNELFFKLIRENEFAKDSLRAALLAQTGRRYRLGPYRQQGSAPAKPEVDPLETLLESAKSAGVPVEEQ